MNASEIKTAIETVTSPAQLEALKRALTRYSTGIQLMLVDTLIDARARVEALWAKTAPVLTVGAN